MSKYNDCVALIRRHHCLVLDGKGDGPEADKICDELEIIWPGLNEHEREQVTSLSADLNRISMDQINKAHQ